MQIFLSFPSELESAAEEVAQSLRNRDYDVFFSHDDLPPGDSFDARVEAAISKSDFMVYLISPESVTKGRYTLTEMGFARTKWPNPSKRVLPVMAVPTPIEKIPSYLRGVTILEPEGSMAAETRAAVDRILRQTEGQSGRSPMLVLAILALLSAIGCYFAYDHSPRMLRQYIGDVPIWPGVIFGVVVAICDEIFGLKDRFQLALVVVVTALGWVAAYSTSEATFALLDQYSKPIASQSSTSDTSSSTDQPTDDTATTVDVPARPTSERFSSSSIVGYVVGLVGGAVGGAITILGLVLTNPGFRKLESVVVCWVTATIVGSAAFGIFFNFLLMLFAIWQIAVVLTIARGFPPGTAQLPQWLGKVTASASYTSRGAG
jgi:hypothetical protein